MARRPHASAPALAFPTHQAERERARELFGIDIEASLREWMTQLVEDRAEELVRRQGNGARPAATLNLTERERQVVSLAAAGLGQGESGAALGIGAESVKSHRRNAYRKLGAANATHAVVLAVLLGEIDFPLLRAHVFRPWGC